MICLGNDCFAALGVLCLRESQNTLSLACVVVFFGFALAWLLFTVVVVVVDDPHLFSSLLFLEISGYTH